MQKQSSYPKKLLRYSQNPKNYGVIKNPDGVGRVKSPICGDITHFYIKVRKKRDGKEYIIDMKFQTLGCIAAIASSNMLVEVAKGKTLDSAIKINRQKIVSKLGGLPNPKLHCSVLAIGAFLEAIYDYLSKNKKPIPKILLKKHKKIEKERKELKRKIRGLN